MCGLTSFILNNLADRNKKLELVCKSVWYDTVTGVQACQLFIYSFNCLLSTFFVIKEVPAITKVKLKTNTS